MTYIILAAGKGANLFPLTLKYPKTSYKLDENTTVIQHLVRSIRSKDKEAEIVVVVGYLADTIKDELAGENVKFIFNPFYETTNSISSLWFARGYMERENVTILHGDVVFDDYILTELVVRPTDFPYVLIDKNRITKGEYNVVLKDDKVLVMSKALEKADAKYSCMIKLDSVSARLLKEEINIMLQRNMYDQFCEDAIVQMIMFHDFEIGYKDVEGHDWSEVNTVDDLLSAQQIYRKGR